MASTENDDSARIVGNLKTVLRAKKITYGNLAKRLKLSEAGVKRLFNAKDISMNRAFQICRAIDVAVADIIGMPNERIESVELSHAQVTAFEQDENLFRFLCKVAIEQCSIEDIARDWKIGRHKMNRYLQDLERLGFIRRFADDRIEFILPKLPLLNDTVPCVQRLKIDAAREIIDEGAKHGWSAGSFRLSYFPLLESSRSELIQAISSLIEEFSERSLRERTLHGAKALKQTTLMSFVANRGFTPTVRTKA